MTRGEKVMLRSDFKDWSGGMFPPGDEYELTVFIDYALDAMYDPDEVREYLRDWADRYWRNPPEECFDIKKRMVKPFDEKRWKRNGMRRHRFRERLRAARDSAE